MKKKILNDFLKVIPTDLLNQNMKQSLKIKLIKIILTKLSSFQKMLLLFFKKIQSISHFYSQDTNLFQK